MIARLIQDIYSVATVYENQIIQPVSVNVRDIDFVYGVDKVTLDRRADQHSASVLVKNVQFGRVCWIGYSHIGQAVAVQISECK